MLAVSLSAQCMAMRLRAKMIGKASTSTATVIENVSSIQCSIWLMQTVCLSRVAVRALRIVPFFRGRAAELIPSGERTYTGQRIFLGLNALMTVRRIHDRMCEHGLRLLPMSVRSARMEIEILCSGFVEDMP